MTLLAPWDAVIAAAVGLPVLLLLYMLKLRRRPLRVGSILFWPAAERDVQANEPLRWIRPSWLFFLHLFALLALVLALGRPALQARDQLGQRVVIIIDASASMSAVEPDPDPSAPPRQTRLDRAKARALEIVDEITGGHARREVAVLTLAAESRPLQGFTGSRAALVDAINAVTPTDQPGNLKAAMDLADALSASNSDASGATAEADAQPPTVVLVSDGSFREPVGGVEAGIAVLGPRVRFERIGPPLKDANADTAPTSKDPDNLGIVGLAATRDATDPTVVRLFVDLENSAGEPRTASLLISLDGQTIARRAVEVPAAKSPVGNADAAGPRESGRASSTFEIPAQSAGVLIVALMQEDSLRADNAAALVLPAPKRPTILLVQPATDRAGSDPAATPTMSAGGWLLSDALQELRPKQLQTATPEQFLLRSVGDGLRGIDLVVFDCVTPERWPAVPTLSFGIAPSFAPISIEPATTGQTGALLWLRQHPALRFVSLEGLVVAQTLGVQLPSAASPAPTSSGTDLTELIRGQQGPLLILANDRGVRRVAACFDLAQSNWPLQLSFPIFLSNALDLLAFEGEQATGRAFRTDEPALVRVKPGDSTITLTGPATIAVRGGSAPVRESPDLGTGAASPISVGLVTNAGVYAVQGDGSLDSAVAINLLDETESALASPAQITVGSRTMATGGRGLSAIELWPWLLIAAAGLLTIEWVVYGRSVRA